MTLTNPILLYVKKFTLVLSYKYEYSVARGRFYFTFLFLNVSGEGGLMQLQN